MDALPAVVAAAAGLFAGTNIDDLVVLSVLSAAARATGRPRRWQIWAGQFAGMTVLVAVSLAVGRGLAAVPHGRLWLLALLPLGLGAARLAAAIGARRRGEQAPVAAPGGLPGVSGLTIASGGDNLAAYAPVFATISAGAATVTVAVFTAGTALWCLAGSSLASHRQVTRLIQRHGHWLVPAVYLVIGVCVLWETGTLTG
ncbi:cadmium resistance transporter [Trebonia sp.]|uniref:cadmium resistance transporter n=1 Tax=Trebonia sp. TaxID=2767075 RepID=UPI00261D44AD|nr:cadmium resistance transporter [Trebonia sp.]